MQTLVFFAANETVSSNSPSPPGFTAKVKVPTWTSVSQRASISPMLRRRPSIQPLPPIVDVAPTLYFPRLLIGLWALSNDRWNEPVAEHAVVNDLRQYYLNGMIGFDMADIYGPAEKIYGSFIESLKKSPPSSHLSSRLPGPISMTKFVPQPGDMTMNRVQQAVEESLARMKVDSIDLIQLHWWVYKSSAMHGFAQARFV